MQRFILPILVILLFGSTLRGQSSWDISGGAMAGFLMPHHEDMLYLVDGHVKGLELSLSRRTDGQKPWHHAFNFPRWGFTLNGYDLGSRYMGNGLSTRIFFDLPLDKKRLFNLKLSIGAGYIEKPFAKDDNVHNSAIGSHINANLAVEAHANINLSSHWMLRPGIGIHHFSNGAMRMPNSGINLALLRVTALYRFDPQPLPERSIPEFRRSSPHLKLGVSGGMKEIKPIGGRKYAVVNLFAIWQKRFTHKSSLGLEGGVNYNESLEYRADDNSGASRESSDNFRPYLAGIYQLHFDPLSLRFSAGSYVAPRFTDDGMVFFRYHLVYDWERWQIFGGLKSHFAKADNIEIGTAWRLK